MFLRDFILEILVLFLTCVYCEDIDDLRKVNIYTNPGLPNNMSHYNINVVYLRSASSKDVLHFIYSAGNFTETPSIVLMRTSDLSSNISIDWYKFTSSDFELRKSSITKNGKDFSQFGVIFTKIYQYNDSLDKVDMTGNTVIPWTLDQFDWNLHESETKITFHTSGFRSDVKSNVTLFTNSSFINLEFEYEKKLMYNKNMPKLLFNTNNTQFSLILKDLNKIFPNPRFALEFILVNLDMEKNMFIKNNTSIDDEFSPGVFESVNFYGQKGSMDSVKQTYVQWKPVCYVKSEDYTINSISVAKYSLFPLPLNQDVQFSNASDVLKSSLVYLAYSDQIIFPLNKSYSVNITFGMSEDKFYNGYLKWTASFGMGQPPSYELSITIIMIIIFGLGLPFVLVLVGSIYLVIKKKLIKKPLEPYEKIIDSIN